MSVALAPTKVSISVELSATDSSPAMVEEELCSTRTGAPGSPANSCISGFKVGNEVGQVGPEGGMDADGDRSLLADGRVGDGPVAGGVVDGRDDHAVGLHAGGPGEADAGTGCRQTKRGHDGCGAPYGPAARSGRKSESAEDRDGDPGEEHDLDDVEVGKVMEEHPGIPVWHRVHRREEREGGVRLVEDDPERNYEHQECHERSQRGSEPTRQQELRQRTPARRRRTALPLQQPPATTAAHPSWLGSP